MRKSPFIFGERQEERSVAVSRIPGALKTKQELLEKLSADLSFPDHFGRNWDALADCLRDFSWLPPGLVTLVHERLPRLDRKSLATYLLVLKAAVEKWRGHPERKLNVVFPVGEEDAVASILEEIPFGR